MPNSAMGRSNNSTPLMQLQRERARHHYKLHILDQRVGERLYGSGTRPYMSYMDDVVPVRVNPTPPPGMLPRWDTGPSSWATAAEEERSTPHPALPEEELPTYDEVMQNETRYCPVYHGAVPGVPNFPEDSSSTSDSDSAHEGVYQVQDQVMGRNCGHNLPRGHWQDYL